VYKKLHADQALRQKTVPEIIKKREKKKNINQSDSTDLPILTCRSFDRGEL